MRLSDGSEAALRDPAARGALLPSPRVAWAARESWRRQALHAWLHESALQIGALRRGLSAVVPRSVLSLVSARELEHWTSGRPVIDIEMLRRHTKYGEGLSASEEHIRFFWSALEGFDQESRRQWVLFSRATTRLPCSDDAWGGVHMKILSVVEPSKDDDYHMPTASTCFFNVYLPRYSTLAICREKMRSAMRQCASMSLGN